MFRRWQAFCKGGIECGRVLGQAVLFAGSKRIAVNHQSVDTRRIVRGDCSNSSRHWVIKDPNSSAQHRIARNTKGLPRETEPWRPDQAVGVSKRLSLMKQDRLVVRLRQIVADHTPWPREPNEAVRLAHRIRLVISA